MIGLGEMKLEGPDRDEETLGYARLLSPCSANSQTRLSLAVKASSPRDSAPRSAITDA